MAVATTPTKIKGGVSSSPRSNSHTLEETVKNGAPENNTTAKQSRRGEKKETAVAHVVQYLL